MTITIVTLVHSGFLHSPIHSNCPPLLVDGSLLHRRALASAVYEDSTTTTEPTNTLLLSLNTTMQQHIPSRDLGQSLRHGCHQNCTTSQCPCFGKMQCLHKALQRRQYIQYAHTTPAYPHRYTCMHRTLSTPHSQCPPPKPP